MEKVKKDTMCPQNMIWSYMVSNQNIIALKTTTLPQD